MAGIRVIEGGTQVWPVTISISAQNGNDFNTLRTDSRYDVRLAGVDVVVKDANGNKVLDAVNADSLKIKLKKNSEANSVELFGDGVEAQTLNRQFRDNPRVFGRILERGKEYKIEAYHLGSGWTAPITVYVQLMVDPVEIDG